MAITKRGQRYQVKVRSPDGQWWTQTVDRLEDARKIEREMRSAKDRGEPWVHPVDRVGRLTLRAVAETFILAQKMRLRPRTVERYARELETFVSWAEDQRKPLASQLNRALLRHYYAHLTEDGGRWGHTRKHITINQHLKTAQLLWAWAYEHDDEHDWDELIPRPRRIELPTARPRLTVAPTWAEMDDMIACVHIEWTRRSTWLQRFTALRIGEALSLRWDDVDLQRGELIVRPEASKGGYSGRVVPMSAHLVAEMQTWSSEEPIICSDVGLRANNSSRPSRVYNTAWKRSGVREGAWKGQQTHAFRKGVISGLHALGAPPDAVEILAGHSLGGTRRPYLDPEIAFNLRQVVGLIPAVGASEE